MEIEILNLIQQMRTPLDDRLMTFISRLGNGGMIWICLALILILIPRTRKCGFLVLAALIVDVILCNGILKNVVRRVRPCDINQAVTLLIPRPEDYSFPSGHTAASFAAVTALYLGHQKLLSKIAVVLAVMIAFSRMYLYVHYPSDILGGIVVGIASGWIGYFIVRGINRENGKKVIMGHS